MQMRTIEIIVGAFMLAGLLSLAILATRMAGWPYLSYGPYALMSEEMACWEHTVPLPAEREPATYPARLLISQCPWIGDGQLFESVCLPIVVLP